MGLLAEHADDLASLAVYAVGIALYTLAVAVLYVPMGTRLMFARRVRERYVATMSRRLAFVLLFPFVSFLFFLVISASMLFMDNFSAGNLAPREVMTIAMAAVLAVRVCAYVSETAAADLAKVMPLSMLAVVLVTNGVADLRQSVQNLGAFTQEPALLGIYFLIVVVVEYVLRVAYELMGRPQHKPRA